MRGLISASRLKPVAYFYHMEQVTQCCSIQAFALIYCDIKQFRCNFPQQRYWIILKTIGKTQGYYKDITESKPCSLNTLLCAFLLCIQSDLIFSGEYGHAFSKFEILWVEMRESVIVQLPWGVFYLKNDKKKNVFCHCDYNSPTAICLPYECVDITLCFIM